MVSSSIVLHLRDIGIYNYVILTTLRTDTAMVCGGKDCLHYLSKTLGFVELSNVLYDSYRTGDCKSSSKKDFL